MHSTPSAPPPKGRLGTFSIEAQGGPHRIRTHVTYRQAWFTARRLRERTGLPVTVRRMRVA